MSRSITLCETDVLKLIMQAETGEWISSPSPLRLPRCVYYLLPHLCLRMCADDQMHSTYRRQIAQQCLVPGTKCGLEGNNTALTIGTIHKVRFDLHCNASQAPLTGSLFSSFHDCRMVTTKRWSSAHLARPSR